MKTLLQATIAVTVLTLASIAFAQEMAMTAVEPTTSVILGNQSGTMRAGLHFGMGMANAGGKWDDDLAGVDLTNGGDLKTNGRPRFAGEFGVNFNYFLNDKLALDAGLGFVGKGYRISADSADAEFRCKFLDLEIPLGVLLEIPGVPMGALQFGAYLALDFVLSGKVVDSDRNVTKIKDDAWDDIRRFNFGPKLFAGYAIKLPFTFATLYVIPGIDFSFHFLNDSKASGASDASARAINLMFRVGVAYQF